MGSLLSTLKNSVLLNEYLIPTSLLLAGTAIIKPEWTNYAILLSAFLIGTKVYKRRERVALSPSEFREFELKEITFVNYNSAIYRFLLPGPNYTLGLPTGQHISIEAEINGKKIQRSYTPISSNRDKGYFDLLVKTYPNGNISKYISEMKIGQTLRVRGPKGAMIYTQGLVREFGMIAGGTGITPMLSIIREIISNPNDPTKCTLIYANVTEQDILLREEIDELARRDSRLKVYHVLQKPTSDNWDGGVGFVTKEMIEEHCPKPSKEIKVLLCGPPPMLTAMKKHLHEIGYDKARPLSKLDDQIFAF